MTVPGSAVQALYPVLAPLIEAAIPAHDAVPMTAREIFQRVGFSTINVTRTILRAIVAEGRAVRSTETFKSASTIHRYRQTAALEAP